MSDDTDSRLESETVKWLTKIEDQVSQMGVTGEFDKKKLDTVIENIHAYIKDCKHFMEKRDLINAFEAVIYAWGILETCQHLGLIDKK
jgi:hypothetical protein